MGRGKRARRRSEPASKSIPCGGKGWAAGECDFCRRKGADYCALRNQPRAEPAVVTIVDVLRGMRRGGRCGGC